MDARQALRMREELAALRELVASDGYRLLARQMVRMRDEADSRLIDGGELDRRHEVRALRALVGHGGSVGWVMARIEALDGELRKLPAALLAESYDAPEDGA